MSAEDLPPDVRRLIIEQINSVAQLELLLLIRMNAQTQWTAAQVSREMRVEAPWSASQLEYLATRGLVERVPASEGSETSYRSRQRSDELEQTMAALAQAYLLHRVRVIELIHSKPSQSIRAFADAFRIRKESNGG
jgi:hypothetical protein